MSKIYTPPSPPTAPDAVKHEALTDAQLTMYTAVLQHFTADGYSIPDIENGQLTELEKFWLSNECFQRFLRAVKWKSADAAIRRLEVTLKWRREFGLYDKVNAAHVEPEALTGKQVIFGYDTHGRPALYLIPSRQNTTENPCQVDFTVWMLERTIDLMGPGVEDLALLINFADRGKSPSMATSRKVLNILQEHYPERLGMALIINLPFIINAFFKLITPFVDPHTREKMKFNIDAVQDGIFVPENIMKEHWGGTSDFEYEHEKYWKALVELTEKRTQTWLANWRALGGTVGLKEFDFKTGSVETEKVVAQPETTAAVSSSESEKSPQVEEEAVAPVIDVAA
ncbi:CRAL/TRIO domain-containing protein [Hymenopellis radicata]|nr:CRAL/TRIO domain-containing protein [Hymenopellis radicata]